MLTFLWMPGAVAPIASPLYTLLGTVCGGLLSESLNQVWAGQAITRYWVPSAVGYFQKAWIRYEQVRLC